MANDSDNDLARVGPRPTGSDRFRVRLGSQIYHSRRSWILLRGLRSRLRFSGVGIDKYRQLVSWDCPHEGISKEVVVSQEMPYVDYIDWRRKLIDLSLKLSA